MSASRKCYTCAVILDVANLFNDFDVFNVSYYLTLFMLQAQQIVYVVSMNLSIECVRLTLNSSKLASYSILAI